MLPDKEEISGKIKSISVRFILISLIFILVIALLYYLTDEVVLEKEQVFDTTITGWLNFESMPQLKGMMALFTFFGSEYFLIAAYLTLGAFYFFSRNNRRQSLTIVAVGFSSGMLLILLKNIFKRARPENRLLANVVGYSYPSGHSFSSFTFCGILIYLIWQLQISKGVKYFFTLLLASFATMIALSRVYFRVHYPSDVIAGFLISVLWLSLCYLVLIKWNLPQKLFGKKMA